MATQDEKDLETLQGFLKMGILAGDKIKGVVASWDSPAPCASGSVDACVKISTAMDRLDCSREQVKLLANAGYLQRFYARRGSKRACGITSSSLEAYLVGGANRHQQAR